MMGPEPVTAAGPSVKVTAVGAVRPGIDLTGSDEGAVAVPVGAAEMASSGRVRAIAVAAEGQAGMALAGAEPVAEGRPVGVTAKVDTAETPRSPLAVLPAFGASAPEPARAAAVGAADSIIGAASCLTWTGLRKELARPRRGIAPEPWRRRTAAGWTGKREARRTYRNRRLKRSSRTRKRSQKSLRSSANRQERAFGTRLRRFSNK